MRTVVHNRPSRPRTSRSRGQALVELALVTPVLLLLLLGALDLGRVFYARISVTNAAREAALFAAGGGANPADAAVAEARGGFVVVTSGNVTTEYSDAANHCSSAATFGSSVNVSVKATFQAITPYIGALLGGQTVILSSTATAQCALLTTETLAVPSGGYCTVPDLMGTLDSDAQAAWSAASFTGAVTKVGTGTGWTIQSQSLVGDTSALCTSGITIYKSTATPSPTPTATPSPTPTATPTPTPTPTPTATPTPPAMCTVPSIGKNWYFSDYQDAWTAAGFTGSLTDNTGGHKVGSVSPLAEGSSEPCTASEAVNR